MLTDDELRGLLVSPEDTFLERKPNSINAFDIRKALVAFANSVPEKREAVLFIGIGDKGEVLGVENVDKKQKDVRRIAQEECFPSIEVEIRALELDAVHVLAVMVPFSRNRPHFAGAAYIRRGSQSVSATRELYDELIASRHDKCRVIQQWGRNRQITVMEDRYRLDKGRVQGEWRARRDCMLLDCDQHTVRVMDLGSQQPYRVGLRQVEIGFDDERNRPQLTVGP